MRILCCSLVLAFAVTGCGEMAVLPPEAGVGPDPQLPPPTRTFIPTLHIAPATGWPSGATPIAAPGLEVRAFAAGLDHPRWLYVLPNGDVLVAETNAPERPEQRRGIKGWVMKRVMKRAGAGTPSADRITLLRDANGDGTVDARSVFLDGLKSPFGMALVGADLYVANTDGIVRFEYVPDATRLEGEGAKLVELPAGPRNHHWTKNVIASPDGSRLYATVGSNSNVAEYGMQEEEGRAAVWEIERATGRHRIFASGLRNPNGLAWEPRRGQLWTSVNERDEIGSDLVPDYMTSLVDGGFYGWPYSYYGQIVDARVEPPRPDLVARAIKPDFALGAHTAALGLAWAGDGLPHPFREGMFIGLHGSWNRKPPSGYKVIFVPFRDGRPASNPIDVLTGFLSLEGEARGRPVGVAVGADGALLVADDVGNVVWRVAADGSREGSADGS